MNIFYVPCKFDNVYNTNNYETKHKKIILLVSTV